MSKTVFVPRFIRRIPDFPGSPGIGAHSGLSSVGPAERSSGRCVAARAELFTRLRLNFHIGSITWNVYPNNPDAGPGRIHGKSAAYFIYITRLPQGAGGFRAHHHAAARRGL